MSGLDLGLVAAYFAGITLLGAWAGRHTRTTEEFFLAGRRFSASFVALSCLATVVGSYSFVKYAAAGYQYGLASSQTYLNDWFWMPLFLFGWLPLLHRHGIVSVPEYFTRRFDRTTGLVASAVLLFYLVGYIGINLLTLGTALGTLFGVDPLWMACLALGLCMVYEWTGGQTSVIVTDFVQGLLLLAAGWLLVALGIARLGGVSGFLEALPPEHLRPLPALQEPGFPFVGIFWQDAMAGGVAFYFMNQGVLMRFLSARSLRAARRGAMGLLLVLMPLAAVAVSGGGWIAAALERRGLWAPVADADQVFVAVARALCAPGVFGLVVAALLAALMSTVDTLINACAAILVRDLYAGWWAPGRTDAHLLRAARWCSLAVAAAGLGLVPLYRALGTVYRAHGMFTAAVTPPMVVALLAGFLWPRFHRFAALATLVGGTAAMLVSLAVPALVVPFAHGIDPREGFPFIRAAYGLAVSLAIALLATLGGRSERTRAGAEFTLWALRGAGR